VQFEENKQVAPIWGWVMIAALCAALIAWGLANYLFIPDRPREWDFQDRPDAPGSSIYSAHPTPLQANPPPQIAPLPEAQPYSPATQPGAGR
jgi:hypothetical protein